MQLLYFVHKLGFIILSVLFVPKLYGTSVSTQSVKNDPILHRCIDSLRLLQATTFGQLNYTELW